MLLLLATAKQATGWFPAAKAIGIEDHAVGRGREQQCISATADQPAVMVVSPGGSQQHDEADDARREQQRHQSPPDGR
jgi:hypothetical protein